MFVVQLALMAPNSRRLMVNKRAGTLAGVNRVGIARKNSNNLFDDFTAVRVHNNCSKPQAG